jgi:hypothetical protein
MNASDPFGSVNAVFKKCSLCDFVWSLRDDFLRDPNIEIIGYQVHFEELKEGFFLFNHSCKGTLTIPVVEFIDLYDGPIFKERVTGSEDCPGYCLYEEELGPCPAKCECAYIREIIQVVKNYKN